MTNETPVQSNDRYLAADPRSAYLRATDIVGAVLADVSDDDLRRPTPCQEFDVEALTRHIISVGQRVTAAGQGVDTNTVPLDARGVETGRWADAWATTIEQWGRAWEDDAVLGKDMILPFGVLPGAVTLAAYISELLVHAWDLSAAIGRTTAWDDELAEASLQFTMVGIPAEGRGEEMPFDPVVPTADDAPVMDRLVAWQGRNPQWI